MSVLKANVPASIANLTWELTACGPQALESFQTGNTSLSVSLISLYPLHNIKKSYILWHFFSVFPVSLSQVDGTIQVVTARLARL